MLTFSPAHYDSVESIMRASFFNAHSDTSIYDRDVFGYVGSQVFYCVYVYDEENDVTWAVPVKPTTFRERKTEEFKKQILSWDWEKIESLFEPFTPEFSDDDGKFEAVYVGTIFGLTPSSKFYTFWTSNQTARDVILDECWWAAFEAVLNAKNYWHDCGGGCGSDIFICRRANETETNG